MGEAPVKTVRKACIRLSLRLYTSMEYFMDRSLLELLGILEEVNGLGE